MKHDHQAFAVAGLAVAAVAVTLAVWLGGAIAAPRTSWVAAGALAIGDIAAALWVAGAAERAKGWIAWARVGLVAAILSFAGLWLIAIPLAFFALSANGVAATAGAAAVAIVAGALIVWATHRLAWRRFAPKDAAP